MRLSLFLLLILSASVAHTEDRLPAVAGQFYPADPVQLARDITGYLNNVPQPAAGRDVLALVVPHAGYPFSAQVAAYAFKQVAGKKYDTVVLLGKSHHEGFRFGAVWPNGAFHTPLGAVPVSPLAGKLIAASPLFRAYADPHLPEHSLEVELPFLQQVAPGVRIIPVLFGFDDADAVREMARVLADVLQGHRALIVASTDLSHYPGFSDACRVDSTTLASWNSMDPGQIRAVEHRQMDAGIPGLACTICGNAAVYVAMLAAQQLGAENIEILTYANSGHAAGPSDRTVGYGAAAIYR